MWNVASDADDVSDADDACDANDASNVVDADDADVGARPLRHLIFIC